MKIVYPIASCELDPCSTACKHGQAMVSRDVFAVRSSIATCLPNVDMSWLRAGCV